MHAYIHAYTQIHTYTHTQMGTKTISIMDDAYEILKRNKKEGESFSDVIRRTMPKKDIMKFAGRWKDIDTEKMKKDIQKLRKQSTMELLRK